MDLTKKCEEKTYTKAIITLEDFVCPRSKHGRISPSYILNPIKQLKREYFMFYIFILSMVINTYKQKHTVKRIWLIRRYSYQKTKLKIKHKLVFLGFCCCCCFCFCFFRQWSWTPVITSLSITPKLFESLVEMSSMFLHHLLNFQLWGLKTQMDRSEYDRPYLCKLQ